MIYDSSNVVIRNLRARYFLNDGFNFGGRAENLRFENVEGSFNGDEGFSAHGEASAYVTDSSFHHNDNGIADTVYSRTNFQRVSVYDNRTIGILFLGGEHSLTDVKMWANPTGVVVEPIYPLPLPGHEHHPYRNTRVTMRNTLIQDGSEGLKIGEDCSAAVDYCTFAGQPIGIVLMGTESKVHLINSIVHSSEQALQSSGKYFGDYNCWSAQTATIKGNQVPLADWFKMQKMEEHSILGDPLLDARDPSCLLPASPARGKAFIDPEYQTWIRKSAGWSEDHLPTVSRDLGTRTDGDQ